MLRTLRNAFIGGLILLVPLGVTLFVIQFLLNNIGATASDFFFGYLKQNWGSNIWIETLINIVSLLIVITLITIMGFLSRYFIGKWTINTTERIISRLPFINTIYNTAKQIVDTFSKQKKAVFQKTVLVEYPRKGAYALGFLTGDAKGEVQKCTGEEVLNVFVPTTPNPTSGFLLMIPREEVTFMEMSVTDGMKLIISGGAVVPPYPYPNDEGTIESDEAKSLKNPSPSSGTTPNS